MTTYDLDALLAAMAAALRADPGDDVTRAVYADALDEAGDEEEAATQRAIARMGLRLYDGLSNGELADIRSAYADHFDADDVEGIWVRESFDMELLIATYRVGDDNNTSEGPYVISGTRGDLTVDDLRRLVEENDQ